MPMKKLFFAALFFLPLPASASVLLADCDPKPYQVIVHNGGQQRVVTLTHGGGEIEEFGTPSQISFQIQSKEDNQPVMRPLSPDEEFCIWSGQIKVQRLNTGGSHNGGISLR